MIRVETENRIFEIVLTGMFMCIIILSTSILKVSIPFSQGYVHIGDAIIFLSVLMLGKKYGAVAAGAGSAMADFFCGFAIWAPSSFVIKFLMAYLMGTVADAFEKKEGTFKRNKTAEIFAMLAGGTEMITGYFFAGKLLYGSWAVSATGIPWNVGQLATGIVLCLIMSETLKKTPLKKYFVVR